MDARPIVEQRTRCRSGRASGASRGTLWIDLPADAEAEGPEEFIVQLQTGSAGVTVTPRTLVVRILNGEGLYLDGFESGCAAP